MSKERSTMLDENRLKHMLGVARLCYELAEGSETYKREMWLMGFLHDIGYEFDENNHAEVGAKLLADTFGVNGISFPIEHHGGPMQFGERMELLNYADMCISPTGERISIDERLKEIESRGKTTIPLKTTLRNNRFAKEEQNEKEQ